MMMNMNELIKNYTKIGHPIAFSAPSQIYNYYKGKISYKKIKDVLASIDSYTLHKQIKKPKPRNPTFVYEPRERWDIDLIEIKKFAKKNKDIKFLLNAVDIFSR